MTRPTHSKALVYAGTHGKLELNEIPLPMLSADQALVRVTGCTLCGSDLHSLHGRRQVPMPTILGHEIVGEIVEMGEQFPALDMQNKSLRPGDVITWAIVANCGYCFYCRRGLEQKCEQACKYGHMGFGSGHELSGGLAEYCVLAAGTHAIKLPTAAMLEVFTPASCATATVIAALETLRTPPSDDSHIAFIGAGMLGLTACAVAKASGWKRVVAIDPIQSKREMAMRFGATHAYSPEEWQSERDQSRDYGCDAVVELSGAQSMIVPGLESLRIGGLLVLVGAVFPVPSVSLLPEQLIRRQLTVRGIHNYRPAHLSSAVQFLAESGTDFPFAELVTSWHSLSEVQAIVRNGLTANVVRLGVKP
jgi:putative phosphonate catabolism associated alcohol dehydrogenase